VLQGSPRCTTGVIYFLIQRVHKTGVHHILITRMISRVLTSNTHTHTHIYEICTYLNKENEHPQISNVFNVLQ